MLNSDTSFVSMVRHQLETRLRCPERQHSASAELQQQACSLEAWLWVSGRGSISTRLSGCECAADNARIWDDVIDYEGERDEVLPALFATPSHRRAAS